MDDERRFQCFLCDNWPILAAVILLIAAVISLRFSGFRLPILTVPLPTAIPLPTIFPQSTVENTSMSLASTPDATATFEPTQFATQSVIRTATTQPTTNPTLTPLPNPSGKPEMVFAILPVNWSSSRAEFMAEAKLQMDLFRSESGVENYFTIRVLYLEQGLENADLTRYELLDDIMEAGATQQPADRYIGITDQDLAPDGNKGVGGWAPFYGQVVVAENSEVISAHELGHTYGLCDEYSYTAWHDENEELVQGCPNPFPASCAKTDGIGCAGTPTDDGRNSIMGSGGTLFGFGYNRPGRLHLIAGWKSMREEVDSQ